MTGESTVMRALREREERKAQRVAAPAPAADTPAEPRGRGRPPHPVVEMARMLGGRVPDSIFRRFSDLKEDAELSLGVRKVTNEQALEAMVRALEDPDVRAAWFEAIRDVRGE